jgi:hypothetical protein
MGDNRRGLYPSNNKGEDDAENGDVDVLGLEKRLSSLSNSARDGFQTIVRVSTFAAVASLEGPGEGGMFAVGDGDVNWRAA